MTDTQKILEEMVRDFCSVTPNIKSEVRRRISESIQQALAEERVRVRGVIENKRADLRREMRKLDFEGENYLNSPVEIGHCYLKRLEDLKEVKDEILSSLDKPDK